MAFIDATEAAVAPNLVVLGSAQTTNVDTTNIADRGANIKYGATKLRFWSVAGVTPTVTCAIMTSVDGTNWIAATYADISTPTTDVSTTFAITTSTLTEKIVKLTNWRWLKVTYSANTNVTISCDLVYDDVKRLY